MFLTAKKLGSSIPGTKSYVGFRKICRDCKTNFNKSAFTRKFRKEIYCKSTFLNFQKTYVTPQQLEKVSKTVKFFWSLTSFRPQSNNCLVPVRIAVKNGEGEWEGNCNKKWRYSQKSLVETLAFYNKQWRKAMRKNCRESAAHLCRIFAFKYLINIWKKKTPMKIE